MRILDHNSSPRQLTRPDMKAAVEAKLCQIQDTTNDLLQQTVDADAVTTNEIRAEVTRLAGIGFTITRLLCFDDVERAYALVNGDAAPGGDVLGLTA